MLTFIYPSDFFKPKNVDEAFAEEASFIKELGHKVITQNTNTDFEGSVCIYRGWMLSDLEYNQLELFVQHYHGTLLTSQSDYYKTHHLPNYYPLIKDVTPETFFLEKSKISVANLEIIWNRSLMDGWNGIFVKDYVKSLTTTEGSVAKTKQSLVNIVTKLDDMRGVEGGLSLRRLENFVPETEVRYFYFQGQIFSPNNEPIPDVAYYVADKISSPFFSIDVIKDTNGKYWVVEIGDGQVSGFKNPWNKESIQAIFKDA
jgi:hypothetical protein